MSTPALPDTSDDHCAVCLQSAPFIERNRNTGEVLARYCHSHVPESWGMPKSLVRMIEDEYLRHMQENGPAAEEIDEPASKSPDLVCV